MGSTTKTPNLVLPQFSDADKPTWRGDINDAMSRIDGGHGSLQGQIDAANAASVKHGELLFNVKDYGAVGNNIVDDTAAIQAALDAAAAAGGRAFARGVFKIASTVIIKGNADFGDATFNYSGATIAVRVGSGALNRRYRVILPMVVCSTKPANGWVAGTVGVRLYNLNQSTIVNNMINGFETGLQVYTDSVTGSAYNTINVGSLVNNQRNLHLTAVTNGYVNQNLFIGGDYSHGSNEGINVAGTRQILIDHITTGNNDPNNNTWIGASMESPNVAEFILDVSGSYNQWINCRFEYSVGTAKVVWRASAARNLITGGTNVDGIVETWIAGAGSNVIMGTSTGRFMPGSAQGLIFENSGSSAYPAMTLMPAGASAAGTSPITGYMARFGSKWQGKNSTDTNDRYSVDTSGRVITYGAGISASAVTDSWFGGSPEGVITANVGSGYVDYTSGLRWRKAVGATSTGWAPVLGHGLLAKTAGYTLVATDDLVTFNGVGLNAQLPDPTTAPVGRKYVIKNLNASALTVASAGVTKTIDGAASQSLAQWAVGRYVSDGTQWLVV